MTYRITNWLEKYENAETRKRKSLFWVLVPNGHDGLGFCSLMERKDALEVFGAWVLILQVASKCSTRGSLITSRGRPYSAKDIATMTRAPVESISDALDVLVEIGWITADPSGHHPDGSASHPDGLASHPDKSARRGKSTGVKKERERRKKESPPNPQEGAGGRNGEGVGDVIPSPLSDDSSFLATWDAWCRYQKQSGRRTWGPEMRAQQIEHLATMGPGAATESLCHAMLLGLQGPAKVAPKKKGPGGDSVAPARVSAVPGTADEAIKAMEAANE